ncbi:DegT/DnrJ/EryC1/StrS aminotransferase family protein [uncultured Sphingorhabdus sp.]|uniref:DegT/DnrJ/EryC1/StrS family aminotransferase n=1 Tax=uncultured Sphingorhabdus sp. TaxID=1686106 RepID=UPI00261E4B96|nr:DegT/DnrJ/EryC1/StrS family aminotransferase [uncultured Sphingorhabdus sp.]HMS19154.1 DegT/DnrJ/EryC1/StrS family aminotransferase [Sphingorhabdus sp.]
MQFIDLKAQQARIRDDLRLRIDKVLDHGQYIMGPEVAELEAALAAYVGVDHCIGIANGTDAIQIALMALDIEPGDEIITSAFSFIAAAEVIALLRAVPVFVDIDPLTYNCTAEQIARAITPRTKAIIPVDLYGLVSDIDAIVEVAAQHGIPVIEDAAQSMGATYKDRRACSLGTIATTSFFPSKPLGGYGDGGACFTNDPELAARIRSIRIHGQRQRYYHDRIGVNGRLDTLQAAILLAKLPIFDEEVSLRAEVASRYDRLIACADFGRHDIRAPHIPEGYTSVYAQYTVRVPDRDRIIALLHQVGIPTAVHYPCALHRQEVFAGSKVADAGCPESEAAAAQVMSLPMHPYLAETDQIRIVEALSSAVRDVAA